MDMAMDPGLREEMSGPRALDTSAAADYSGQSVVSLAAADYSG
jgi:hypothetical protein